MLLPIRLVALALVGGSLVSACTPAATVPEEAVAPTPTEENPLGACARETKIGVTFSSEDSGAGESHNKGIELATELLNMRGSFGYAAIFEDDNSDPGTGTELLRGFVEEEGVSALVSSSPSVREVASAAERADVPLISLLAADGGIGSIGKNVYSVSLDETVLAEALATTIKAQRVKSLAIVGGAGPTDLESGGVTAEDLRAVYIQALEAEKLKVAILRSADASGDEVRSDIDGAVLVGQAADGPALAEVARGAFPNATLFGSSAIADAVAPELEGLIAATTWALESQQPVSLDFAERFQTKFDAQPDRFAAQGYLSVFLIAAAVETACSNAPEDVARELAKLGQTASPMGRFSFTRTRDADHDPQFIQIKEGLVTVLVP